VKTVTFTKLQTKGRKGAWYYNESSIVLWVLGTIWWKDIAICLSRDCTMKKYKKEEHEAVLIPAYSSEVNW